MSAVAGLMTSTITGPTLPTGISLSATAASFCSVTLRLDKTGVIDHYVNGVFQGRPWGPEGSNQWAGSERDFFYDGEEWEARWTAVSGDTAYAFTAGVAANTWRVISPTSDYFQFGILIQDFPVIAQTKSVVLQLDIRDPTSLAIVASGLFTFTATVTV